MFIVRNSWGEQWGDKGYCYIPFNYMTNPKMIFDVVTIRSVDEQLNKIIGSNIWGKTLGYFDDGVNNQQRVELLSNQLKEEEISYQEKINMHKTMSEMLFKQDRLFKDIGFRNDIEAKLQVINNKDINKIEEELKVNESNLTAIQQKFDALKAREKLFVYKWIGAPIAVLFCLFGVYWYLGKLDVLVAWFFKDLTGVFVLDWHLIDLFRSMSWVLLFSWTVYCAYKYFKNYYLVFQKYNKERKSIKIKDKKEKVDIVNLYHDKWKLKFDYNINTQLLEEVLNGVKSFISEKLKGLNEFIESLKQFRERVSGSYKEVILKETVFSRNIFKIPDSNNIEQYYNQDSQDNQISLVKEGFSNEKTMLDYYNEFLSRNDLFEQEIEKHWTEKKTSYLNKYTLSNLFENNYFNINEKVGGWNEFLKIFSNPLLDVSDSYLELKAEKSFDVYFSNNGFRIFADQLVNSMNDVNVNNHQNNDEIIVFRFTNTFPAYYISCFEHLHASDDLADYFIYDKIPRLKLDNN